MIFSLERDIDYKLVITCKYPKKIVIRCDDEPSRKRGHIKKTSGRK